MIAKIIFHINVLELIGLGFTVLFFLFFYYKRDFQKRGVSMSRFMVISESGHGGLY